MHHRIIAAKDGSEIENPGMERFKWVGLQLRRIMIAAKDGCPS